MVVSVHTGIEVQTLRPKRPLTLGWSLKETRLPPRLKPLMSAQLTEMVANSSKKPRHSCRSGSGVGPHTHRGGTVSTSMRWTLCRRTARSADSGVASHLAAFEAEQAVDRVIVETGMDKDAERPPEHQDIVLRQQSSLDEIEPHLEVDGLEVAVEMYW
jgi:hypothetical protein